MGKSLEAFQNGEHLKFKYLILLERFVIFEMQSNKSEFSKKPHGVDIIIQLSLQMCNQSNSLTL